MKMFFMRKQKKQPNRCLMIGKTGFEPATPWSQTKYSTKLSYFPTMVTLTKKKLP